MRANLGSGNDLMRRSRVGEVTGDTGNDRLIAYGAVTVRGGPGDDLIKAWREHLKGYAENTPCVSYRFAAHPVHVNLTTGRAVGEGHDRLVHLRCIDVGSRFGDVLVGSPNNDMIDPGVGRQDRVFARDGDDFVSTAWFGGDYIVLGAGDDRGTGRGDVFGGPGTDLWREVPID